MITPLSLHDALPISDRAAGPADRAGRSAPGHCDGQQSGLDPADPRRARSDALRHGGRLGGDRRADGRLDRKSTRLNSSHVAISYAVFCLKKKKTENDSNLRIITHGTGGVT